jgi:tetratricopeptide (TPR) repeat protein
MKKKFIEYMTAVVILMASAVTAFARGTAPTIKSPLKEFYLATNFQKIVETLDHKSFSSLPTDEKLLFIECLARTSRNRKASDLLKPILKQMPTDTETLVVAGIVEFSMGRLEEAESLLSRVLESHPHHIKALISSTVLALHSRDFSKARNYYQSLTAACEKMDAAWIESDILFTLGLELYRATGEPDQLARLYNLQAKLKKRKKIYKSLYRSLNTNARMHKRAAKKMKSSLFEVSTTSEKVSLPFVKSEKEYRWKMVSLTYKGKIYKVALDTGNTTGWMVHNRSLNEALKPVDGGRTLAHIGTEAGVLDGYREFYRTVEFDGFSLNNVYGIYVPKPHPDFPDANLNPSFIKNRIASIDFVEQRLILRTPQRFVSELKSKNPPEKIAKMLPIKIIQSLPWYGYKYIYVPTIVSGKQGLAVIETGAEDIALKTDFIKDMKLPLRPKKKYLANGQVVKYHAAAVEVLLGNLRFHRAAADVWPLDRFFDRLSGIAPDIVIGPDAFRNAFIVSFDPFNRNIILEYFSRRPGPL